MPGRRGSWTESGADGAGSSSGMWTLKIRARDFLEGAWTDPQRRRAEPIQLKRFKTLSSSDARPGCAVAGQDGITFNPDIYKQTRAEKIVAGKIETFNGKTYRVLLALGGRVRSVELIADGEVVASLNARLANQLKINMANYYTCPTLGTSDGKKVPNGKPNFSAGIEPIFWNERWISLAQYVSGDCGGAHPFSDVSNSTWNLKTGESVNLWTWIKNSRKKDVSSEYDAYYFNYAAPEKLNRLIADKATKARLAFNPKEAQDSPNCMANLKENNEYELIPGKNGLIFSHRFPHVSQACNDSIEIPFGSLLQFLTKEGKMAIDSLAKPNRK